MLYHSGLFFLLRTSHSYLTILAYLSINSLEEVYVQVWNTMRREQLHYTQYKPKHWYLLSSELHLLKEHLKLAKT